MTILSEVNTDDDDGDGDGIVTKDSEFLNRIKSAIEKIPGHPRHKGVPMQAHHAISEKGMSLSKLGKKFKGFKYNINLLPNLVFIPSTLMGACYLGVQPHRGDHVAKHPDDYDDDEHPRTYHDKVKELLIKTNRLFDNECAGEDDDLDERVRAKLNELSRDIIDGIQDKPTEYRLTKIYMHFAPGNKVGCGNVKNVGEHNGANCSAKRKHRSEKEEELALAAGEITYKSNGKYRLEAGK